MQTLADEKKQEGPLAQAFNRGSDARLAGVSFRFCPYEENDLKAMWRQGWIFTEKHWGDMANGWPFMRLPFADSEGVESWLKHGSRFCSRSGIRNEVKETFNEDRSGNHC